MTSRIKKMASLPITIILVSAVTKSSDGQDNEDFNELSGCKEITPNEFGEYSVEGICYFAPDGDVGGIHLHKAKISGVLNETLFHLDSGGVILIAPSNRSSLSLSLGDDILIISPAHETHIVITERGTAQVHSVRGNTHVKNHLTSNKEEILKEGEGKEYALETSEGCSIHSFPTFRDAHDVTIPLILLVCMIVAGRRVLYFITQNTHDRISPNNHVDSVEEPVDDANSTDSQK